ncbi:NUDIX domain-containing protein [Lipingzhangella rawalii]|uniref:NUDIX domain-containing protein n=1 Tax=Lipingzhangella rawalii TaxID=2055835 RepID=UPI00389965F3
MGGAVIHNGVHVLILRRSGRDSFLPGIEELPSGEVEPGQDVVQVFARELAEEWDGTNRSSSSRASSPPFHRQPCPRRSPNLLLRRAHLPPLGQPYRTDSSRPVKREAFPVQVRLFSLFNESRPPDPRPDLAAAGGSGVA